MAYTAKPIAEVSERTPLPPRLDEFRTALEEEIKAAKQAKSNEVLLTEGRFVAVVAGDYLYEFETASPVRVPPDTPGELTVDGFDATVSITVVNIEELTVTLASHKSLGQKLRSAKLQTNLTMLLRRLIDRIEQKAEQTWPAAERLLDGHPVAGEPLPLAPLDLGQKLNPEQHSAVESSLGRNLTFIWGPPGTGKTQTIGSIGRELFLRKRTLLVVSHTNVAIDEALGRIASLCEGRFVEGEIIRIGEPVKAEMQRRTDLICHHVAARRSEALQHQQATLAAEKALSWKRLKMLESLITIVEWADEAAGDIRLFHDAWIELLKLEAATNEIVEQLARAHEERPHWEDRRRTAADAQLCLDQRVQRERTNSEINERRSALASELLRIRKDKEEAERVLVFAREAEPLRQRMAALPKIDVLQHELQRAADNEATQTATCTAHELALSNEMVLLEQAQSMGRIRRLWHKLPDPEEQIRVVTQTSLELEAARKAREHAVNAQAEAEARLHEAEDLGHQLSRFNKVPPLRQQEAVCARLTASEYEILGSIADCDEILRKAQADLRSTAEQLRVFQETYGVRPDELIQQVEAFYQRLEDLVARQQAFRTSADKIKRDLDSRMRGLLAVLHQVGLCHTDDAPLAEMLAIIEQAHSHATAVAREHPQGQLTAERNVLSSRIASIDVEVETIKAQLSRVELDIILNARVVATTLTRAFMRDALQQRQFDTVLCDEASMAPIPALWAASTLAAQSVVVVGDFLQLPPIVQSEHPMAEKWLGRDIFEVSGVQKEYERKKPPAFFVTLRRQFRMHPEIADAPNRLIYRGNLINEEDVSKPEADNALLSWYEKDWGFDQPLLMLDSSKAGGWNNKSGNSRLNFLSAALTVRIARAVLSDRRPKWEEQEGRRILIITPYRPQAALINHLLQDEEIAGEVYASTAHSCQGGEAQLVILDLVVDEPHFATNLTSPSADPDIRRLMNVAMTRAKRRLIVLGNFAWLQLKGGNSFVGADLLPYLLKKRKPVEATKAFVTASTTTRVRTVQATEALTELDKLIEAAKQQVILMSPSVSAHTLATLTPKLLSARRRNVNLFLIIRPLQEKGGCAASERAEVEDQIRKLRQDGVAVVFKSNMHEKLALVDHRVVWTGTFAPLSVNRFGVGEVRGQVTDPRRSRLYEEVAECLGLEHVLSALQEGQLQCPVCANDMRMADSGPKSNSAFYWKCGRKDCYSRNLTEPPIVAGMIGFKCGGRPSLDYRGDDAIWICDCGKRHRCKIKRSHLRLPKMWALVPLLRRKRLLRELGITLDDLCQQDEL